MNRRLKVSKDASTSAKLRSHEAAEIAEAALVLPVVFIFLLGVIWFGRAFNIYSTITQAAQQGAIAAARSNCVTCGDAPTSDINVVAAISSVLQASSLNDPIPINLSPPTPLSCIDFSVLTCSVYNNVTICRQALLNPPAASGNQTSQCGTIVSFQYPFQFHLPFTSLNMQLITLSAQAQSRMEN